MSFLENLGWGQFYPIVQTLIIIVISKQLPFVDVSLRIVDGSNLNGASIRQVLHHGEIGSDIFCPEVDQDEGTGISLFDSDITKDVMSIGCAVEELRWAKEDSLVQPEVGQITVDGRMRVEGVDLRLFQLDVGIQSGVIRIDWEPRCCIGTGKS